MQKRIGLVRGAALAIGLTLSFGANNALAGKAAPPPKSKDEKAKDEKKDQPKACKTSADCDTGPYECFNGTCQVQRPVPPT